MTDSKARRLFWLYLLVHITVWTILPILFHPNAPLDVVEGISWGREWQIGYYKHPALTPWLTNIAYIASGGRLWSIFLLSQLAIATGLWAVWQVARDVVDESEPLACVVLLEGIIYYNLVSPEFNPNVLELAFWPLIVLFAWRVLPRRAAPPAAANNESRSLPDWILLGIFSGLGLFTKYYTGILLLSIFGFFVTDRSTRKLFRTPGPYVSIGVASAVFLPHLLWMMNNGFATIQYAVDRAKAKQTVVTHITFPAGFVGSQLFAVALMLVAFVVLFGFWKPKADPLQEPRDRFLATVALGPFLLTLIISAVLNVNLLSMWGYPLWSFFPLLLLASQRPRGQQTPRKIAAVGAGLMSILAVAFILGLIAEPYVYKTPRKALFPGRDMAEEITADWHSQTGEPLRFVVADTWLAGNVAFYSADRPSTLTDGNPALSPWVNPVRLEEEGAVLVWGEPQMPVSYAERFPRAQEQPPLSLGWQTKAHVPDAVIHWAIVRPEPK